MGINGLNFCKNICVLLQNSQTFFVGILKDQLVKKFEYLCENEFLSKTIQPVYQGPRWVRIMKKRGRKSRDTAFLNKYNYILCIIKILKDLLILRYLHFYKCVLQIWVTHFKCQYEKCKKNISALKGQCHEKSFQTETVGVKARSY